MLYTHRSSSFGRLYRNPIAFSINLSLVMSFQNSAGGSQTSRMTYEFGRTMVVRPKGRHQATIVWLHGLGDKGSRRKIVGAENNASNLSFLASSLCFCGWGCGLSWSQILESLPLPNVKWICPTAPIRPVSLYGGFPCTAWFDAQDISEDAPDDIEGLDASAAHVANLLSTEPAGVKLGIGGFSMGAATALYSATCHIFGQYGNRSPYLIDLSSVISLSGWLPCSRTLRNRMEGSNEAVRRAASLHILLCHGSGDDVVAYKLGEKSSRVLSSAGFQNLMLRSYNGLGHYTIPEEMDDVCRWLTSRLGLQGS